MKGDYNKCLEYLKLVYIHTGREFPLEYTWYNDENPIRQYIPDTSVAGWLFYAQDIGWVSRNSGNFVANITDKGMEAIKSSLG